MEQTDIFEVLKSLNISYELQEHKAIFCEADHKDFTTLLEGMEVKNLFVKDKDGNYGLVSMSLHERADLKKIASIFGFGRLSFCSADELKTFLNITPGSVTPFCIMFDTKSSVRVLFDKNFLGKKVIVHPLRNTASVSLSFEDLKRFTEHFGHSFLLGEFYKEDS